MQCDADGPTTRHHLRGDAVELAEHKLSAWLEILHDLPTIRRAVALHHDCGRWFPVVVTASATRACAGSPCAWASTNESTRPPSVDEVPVDLRVVEA